MCSNMLSHAVQSAKTATRNIAFKRLQCQEKLTRLMKCTHYSTENVNFDIAVCRYARSCDYCRYSGRVYRYYYCQIGLSFNKTALQMHFHGRVYQIAQWNSTTSMMVSAMEPFQITLKIFPPYHFPPFLIFFLHSNFLLNQIFKLFYLNSDQRENIS